MYPIIPATEREHLFQEILDILRQWPELDRRVFFQAHYGGQSPEAISRSLPLDVKKVSAILQQCDSRLHASLGTLRHRACPKTSRTAA
jgi:DNA-directed RNA polymerase specialized sigma24 family protein